MTSHNEQHGQQSVDAILHRFVDGDATPSERATVAALLAGDPEAYTRTCEYQRHNVALQALYPRRVEDTMLPPAALNLAAGLRRGRAIRRAAAACVAAFAVLGAGAAGWNMRQWMHADAPMPLVAVFPQAVAPTPSLTDAAPAPMPAAADAITPDQAAWFDGSAAKVAVHPPNLQSVGYQLVDGRAALTAYGPVIRFAYEPADGTSGAPLALTVAAFGADRQGLATSINPQHASLFWRSGKLLYALSGDVDPASLLRVAETVSVGERSGEAAPEPAAEIAPDPEVSPVSDSAEQPKDT